MASTLVVKFSGVHVQPIGRNIMPMFFHLGFYGSHQMLDRHKGIVHSITLDQLDTFNVICVYTNSKFVDFLHNLKQRMI